MRIIKITMTMTTVTDKMMVTAEVEAGVSELSLVSGTWGLAGVGVGVGDGVGVGIEVGVGIVGDGDGVVGVGVGMEVGVVETSGTGTVSNTSLDFTKAYI